MGGSLRDHATPRPNRALFGLGTGRASGRLGKRARDDIGTRRDRSALRHAGTHRLPTTLDRTSSPIRWHSSKARAGHGKSITDVPGWGNPIPPSCHKTTVPFCLDFPGRLTVYTRLPRLLGAALVVASSRRRAPGLEGHGSEPPGNIFGHMEIATILTSLGRRGRTITRASRPCCCVQRRRQPKDISWGSPPWGYSNATAPGNRTTAPRNLSLTSSHSYIERDSSFEASGPRPGCDIACTFGLHRRRSDRMCKFTSTALEGRDSWGPCGPPHDRGRELGECTANRAPPSTPRSTGVPARADGVASRAQLERCVRLQNRRRRTTEK